MSTVNVNRKKSPAGMIRRLWRRLDSSYRRPILLTGILHVALLVVVTVGWHSNPEVNVVAVPRHINAVVVDASTIEVLNKRKQQERDKKAAEEKRARDKKKKKEQTLKRKKEEAKRRKEAEARKRAAEKKKRQDAERKKVLLKKKKEEQRKLAEKKKREAERRKEQERKQLKERQRKEQERQLQEMMENAERARELELEAQRKEQAQLKANRVAELNEVDRFIALIRAKFTRQWHKPAGAKIGMAVVLRLYFFPTGELSRAEIIKSSGDTAFDNSALSAAKSISRYPVPSDSSIFEKHFRQFSMKFSHRED